MLGEGLTILLVDDEVMNSMILQRRLKKEGFQVEIAGHGEEAVSYVKANPVPALILMDLMMPIMDGWEASRLIKDHNPAIPIIAVSAKVDEENSPNIFDDFCPKPINFEFLIQKMKLYLEAK